MTRQQQFMKRVDDLVRQARALPEASARRIIAMLEEARKEIVARLASAPSGSFSAGQLEQMRQAVDRALGEFSASAGRELASGQAGAFDLGRRLADEPISLIETPHMLGGLSRRVLAIAQGYSADLISHVSSDTRRKVTQALQRAVLGGQPMTDIIDQIGRALTGRQAAPSIFSAAGSRAVTIARTEIPRMLSAATQVRLEEYAERLGRRRIQKEWKHNPQEHPRLNHIKMDGMVVDVDEEFEVPDSGGETLRYPRDPKGSARETVNCGCSVVPRVRLEAA